MTSVGLGLASDQLSQLRMELRGAVLGPLDPGFDERRIPFNAMHADRPDVVVRPTGTADVAAAVRFARQYDLEVVVRGGGHSVGGLSTADGGMVIDLSTMHAVDVDPTHGSRVSRGAQYSASSTERRSCSGLRYRSASYRRPGSPG